MATRTNLPAIRDVRLYMSQLSQHLEDAAREKRPIFRGLDEATAISNIRRNCAEMGTSEEAEKMIVMYFAMRHL